MQHRHMSHYFFARDEYHLGRNNGRVSVKHVSKERRKIITKQKKR
jgi:hypothetical protein